MWSKDDLYRNGTFLAPMVRIGTLPMRLLALDYGADLVYTEELVDLKILRSTRQENKALGTVDFVDRTDGTVVFRTCEAEKERVIFQMGTADPGMALEVAKLVENDVAGIDVNMGCPKEFSVRGGMGVALLQDPSRACAILKRLTSANLKVPVSCKVRVLEDEDKTVELLKSFEACGIQAVAVHGRTKNERQQPNRNRCIRRIAHSLKIPVIANGGSKEIACYEDIGRFKEATGCSSVMIARAAEWNASIFQASSGPPLPLHDVIKAYIRKAIEYDNPPANTKYCIQNMLRDLQTTTPLGRKFLETQTLAQISELWDQTDYYRQVMERHRNHGLVGRWGVVPLTYDERFGHTTQTTVEMEVAFIRCFFPTDPELPKTRLLSHLRSIGVHRLPKYRTIHADKLFKSVVTVEGVSYSSTFWEKNRRWAEQGAAIVCLCSLGVIDKEDLMKQELLEGGEVSLKKA